MRLPSLIRSPSRLSYIFKHKWNDNFFSILFDLTDSVAPSTEAEAGVPGVGASKNLCQSYVQTTVCLEVHCPVQGTCADVSMGDH